MPSFKPLTCVPIVERFLTRLPPIEVFLASNAEQAFDSRNTCHARGTSETLTIQEEDAGQKRRGARVFIVIHTVGAWRHSELASRVCKAGVDDACIAGGEPGQKAAAQTSITLGREQ